MWNLRHVLPLSFALTLLFALLAPRRDEPATTLTARELLELAQRTGRCRYTFDRETAEALARTELTRPPEGAALHVLEADLARAGFSLRAVGPEARHLFQVTRTEVR